MIGIEELAALQDIAFHLQRLADIETVRFLRDVDRVGYHHDHEIKLAAALQVDLNDSIEARR